MTPIHELLSRIRWDPDFGRADFVIGYYDRVADDIITASLAELYFEPGDRFAFHLLDENGEDLTIPLHRIKSVYRNGELIWHREH